MSIPASDIVSVQPSVLSAGGSPLSLNGVILTQNDYVPTNAVPSFTSANAVGDYFGLSSIEYELSQIYFNGYDNSTIKPGTLHFAPYVEADRAAWLQGGSLSGMTLAQLQALSGVLTVTVDGTGFTSGTINLATATSFSNAATLINTAFTGSGKPVCSWDAIKSAFILTSPTTGVDSTITFCTGTLSAGLKFTSVTGAIISPGANEDTAETAMQRIVGITQNWATFMTVWQPDTAGKLAFAEWANDQNQRYAYVAWDTDAQAIVNGSTTTFGYQVSQLEYNGVIPVYNTVELATFTLGAIASIDFSRTNARITMKFRAQSGFAPTVTDQQIAENLRNNGYNFYGVWATANDQFTGFAEGSMPGEWLWIDPYVNQIYLNSQFQLSLMDLLFNVPSIPYNPSGYALIRAAMQDPINQMFNFGGIRAGVTLSQSQKAQVNSAAGLDVSSLIETQGYYLQILDPGAQARALRATPIVNFWYTDGGAVHTINVASINIL